MLSGGRRTTLDGALFGEALGALEEQLRPFAAALAAAWSCIAHGSDSPALRRTAAVVRNRRYILDRLHLQSGSDEGLNGRLASRARTLNADVHAANAERDRFATGLLSGDCRGERDRKSTRLNSSHGYISY